MKSLRSIGHYAVLLALPWAAGTARAIEPVNFEIRNNADLVAVCSTPPSDPNYVAAINFCHGFGVGFYRYHAALTEGKDFKPIFCIPDNMTRTQVLTGYVDYSKARPEYNNETVGDVIMKYLVDTYPCNAKK